MPGLWKPCDAPLVGVLAGATGDLLVVNRAMAEQLAMDEPDAKVLKLNTKLADDMSDIVLRASRAWGSGSNGTESSIQPSSSRAVLGSRNGRSSPRATVSGNVKV